VHSCIHGIRLRGCGAIWVVGHFRRVGRDRVGGRSVHRRRSDRVVGCVEADGLRGGGAVGAVCNGRSARGDCVDGRRVDG